MHYLQSLRLRTFRNLNLYGLFAIVVHHFDSHDLARWDVGNGLQHARPVADGVTIDSEQNVAGLDACFLRWAVTYDFGDQYAIVVAQLEGLNQRGCEFLHACAYPATRHRAMLNDLLHGFLGSADGDGEADTQ